MNIEVVKFPGRVVQLDVENGTTVGQALEIVAREYPEIDLSGDMRVSNCDVSASTQLREGQRVVITKKMKGNQTSVIVTKFPGAKVELMLDHGSTVGAAIDQAKATLGDVDGYDIRLNGTSADSGSVIPDNGQVQRIILTKKMKGN
jgi:hypothetical protein